MACRVCHGMVDTSGTQASTFPTSGSLRLQRPLIGRHVPLPSTSSTRQHSTHTDLRASRQADANTHDEQMASKRSSSTAASRAHLSLRSSPPPVTSEAQRDSGLLGSRPASRVRLRRASRPLVPTSAPASNANQQQTTKHVSDERGQIHADTESIAIEDGPLSTGAGPAAKTAPTTTAQPLDKADVALVLDFILGKSMRMSHEPEQAASSRVEALWNPRPEQRQSFQEALDTLISSEKKRTTRSQPPRRIYLDNWPRASNGSTNLYNAISHANKESPHLPAGVVWNLHQVLLATPHDAEKDTRGKATRLYAQSRGTYAYLLRLAAKQMNGTLLARIGQAARRWEQGKRHNSRVPSAKSQSLSQLHRVLAHQVTAKRGQVPIFSLSSGDGQPLPCEDGSQDEAFLAAVRLRTRVQMPRTAVLTRRSGAQHSTGPHASLAPLLTRVYAPAPSQPYLISNLRRAAHRRRRLRGAPETARLLAATLDAVQQRLARSRNGSSQIGSEPSASDLRYASTHDVLGQRQASIGTKSAVEREWRRSLIKDARFKSEALMQYLEKSERPDKETNASGLHAFAEHSETQSPGTRRTPALLQAGAIGGERRASIKWIAENAAFEDDASREDDYGDLEKTHGSHDEPLRLQATTAFEPMKAAGPWRSDAQIRDITINVRQDQLFPETERSVFSSRRKRILEGRNGEAFQKLRPSGEANLSHRSAAASIARNTGSSSHPAKEGPLPTWLLLSTLQTLSQRADPQTSFRLVRAYVAEMKQLGHSSEDFSNDRMIHAVSKPGEPPAGASLLNHVLRAHLLAGNQIHEAEAAFVWLTGQRGLVPGITGSSNDLPSISSRGDGVIPHRDIDGQEGMQDGNAVHVIPDETTVLLLLSLMEARSDRIHKGIKLVREVWNRWNDTGQKPRLVLGTRTTRLFIKWGLDLLARPGLGLSSEQRTARRADTTTALASALEQHSSRQAMQDLNGLSPLVTKRLWQRGEAVKWRHALARLKRRGLLYSEPDG
ncbi:hypothetical protein IE81DRAFT_319492 [Ceraceosorus guamensis]|uniref:Uncharacterized protein n=1 Tax=Ceraceosorus guamensis TaxID=1522189 RepID=A0A316W877_9BASI|nr:hypothetical protein IE81DRAFT_319492 [Ceraceosorus guamensis]PWN46110.1 hypothetical protein IE81DRAFT_319492 [Ceraceosorus guamensis]